MDVLRSEIGNKGVAHGRHPLGDRHDGAVKEGENSVGKDGDEQRWSLTALWNATRPISLRILAVATSARLIRPNEPLNPVTALFEPATVISGKSLIMMSIKSKMDIEELKRCRTNSGKKNDYIVRTYPPFRRTHPEIYIFLFYYFSLTSPLSLSLCRNKSSILILFYFIFIFYDYRKPVTPGTISRMEIPWNTNLGPTENGWVRGEMRVFMGFKTNNPENPLSSA